MNERTEPRTGPVWAPGYRHLTHDVAPVRFEFRACPEDFQVTEQPLFEPHGEGTHVYFEIEKRGVGTPEAVRRFAAVLERRPADFGFAGRKDAQAVTRQWLSLEHVTPEQIERAEVTDVKVLRVARHPHKLRLGQLAGNHFRIVLRGVDEADDERLGHVLDRLLREGMPNYFGAQRFGKGGSTWRLGLLLLRHEYCEYIDELCRESPVAGADARDALRAALVAETKGPRRRLGPLAAALGPDLGPVARQLSRRPGSLESAAHAVPRRTRGFHLSALQSRVFNRVLAARLTERGSLAGLLPGDVALKHAGGASFLVPDPLPPAEADDLARRAERFEISPSGPLPGSRMLQASGDPGAWEQAALAVEGITLEDFGRLGHGLDLRGARRPLRVPVRGLERQREGDRVILGFELPPGCFATTLLEELRKSHRAG